MSKKKESVPFAWNDEWLVNPLSELEKMRRMYSGGAFYGYGESQNTDRTFADALKDYSYQPPYLVWTGSKLKIFTNAEDARAACTGELAVMFKASQIIENKRCKHEWTETKERIFE